jgi:hypothetical protein
MKNKRIDSLIILTVFLFLISSCTDQSINPSPDEQGHIIPLALNNVWIYRMEVYDTTGAITNTRIDTILVRKDTTIENEIWYLLYSTTRFTNRKDGFYSFYESPTLEYKYPAIPGDSIPITQYLTRRVMSINEIINVNGKSYTAYKYYDAYETTSSTWTLYLVPNIGQVRIDVHKIDSQSQEYLSSRSDLIYYKLH